MLKLILSIAVWLSLNGFYSESQLIFSQFNNLDKLGKEEYYTYHFYYGCSAFATGDKPMAEKHLKLLEDSFNYAEIPKRYRHLSSKMLEELSYWKIDDLHGISRDMITVRDRLERVDGKKYTQKVQQNIVDKLDKHIKDLEDAEKSAKDQQANYEQESKKNNPNKPNDESKIGDSQGKGEVDQKILRKYAENWGTMQPLERQKAITEIKRSLPSRYHQMIEDYYKALNQHKEK
jgi:predicted Fe-S protein YdhL (DUF1289 family)